MKKAENIKITTYEVESPVYKDFMVDIVDDGEMYEAWLWHKNTAGKTFMYGEPKQSSLDAFADEAGEQCHYYIPNYIQENIDIV